MNKNKLRNLYEVGEFACLKTNYITFLRVKTKFKTCNIYKD